MDARKGKNTIINSFARHKGSMTAMNSYTNVFWKYTKRKLKQINGLSAGNINFAVTNLDTFVSSFKIVGS